MTFDISKYAGQIAQATQARVSRENIAQGDHILQIEGVKGLTSQNDGSDYIIIEASIYTSNTMKPGTPVKHMYKLTGVPSWKQKGNLEALKSFVCSVLPPEFRSQVTAEVVINACNGGTESALVNHQVRCRVVEKKSKLDKAFLETNWMPVDGALPQAVTNDDDDANDLPF
jgi:hypothetical protein